MPLSFLGTLAKTSPHLQAYLSLEHQRGDGRLAPAALDRLLDEMDAAWYALTTAERGILDGRIEE